MAGGDRRGPQGYGPMTGRGLGNCRAYPAAGYDAASPPGRPNRPRGTWQRYRTGRRGFFDAGRPYTRRGVNNGPAMGAAAPLPGDPDKTTLQFQAAALQRQLQAIQKRLEEIEK